MATIVRMKLDKVSERVARRFGVPLRYDDGLVDALVAACLLPDTGARNIDSLLDQQILPVLARELLIRMGNKTAEAGAAATIRLTFSDADGIGLEFDEDAARAEADL
ncbi:hypothetical protein D3C87_1378700 [compost metagenome]